MDNREALLIKSNENIANLIKLLILHEENIAKFYSYNILENVMREMLIKGEYTIIDNILEYTNSIQSQLLKYIKTEYEHCLKSLDKLKKLHNDIKVLIENYEMAYLLDIYHELTDKIIREEYVNFERKEKERSEIERRRKEHAEVERREIERAEVERREIEHMEVERKEREIVEKMSCACGIIKVNVCMCNTPKYELVKLSNNLYCIRCSKWKCRC